MNTLSYNRSQVLLAVVALLILECLLYVLHSIPGLSGILQLLGLYFVFRHLIFFQTRTAVLEELQAISTRILPPPASPAPLPALSPQKTPDVTTPQKKTAKSAKSPKSAPASARQQTTTKRRSSTTRKQPKTPQSSLPDLSKSLPGFITVLTPTDSHPLATHSTR